MIVPVSSLMTRITITIMKSSWIIGIWHESADITNAVMKSSLIIVKLIFLQFNYSTVKFGCTNKFVLEDANSLELETLPTCQI